MILKTENYMNLTRLPLMLKSNTYLAEKTDIEEFGHIVVTILKMGKDRSKDTKIVRKAYMDEHGMAILNIDKTKVIFGVGSGNMWLKDGR